MGQTRKVTVSRFVMGGTIEQRMLSLQEAKAALALGAVQKLKPEEARKARLSQLRTLFDLPLASAEMITIDD